jgi:hypothetical protein
MAVLTRIQNNQITDSTIQAQSKIAAGSITGNLLASSVTFNSNITILGNLTVANSYTQLNSINTFINDPVVVFNNNYTGSLTNYDIGILVNRNLASLSNYGAVNTFLGWSESQQAFIAIATTETGTTVSSINNSGYANVVIGNTTASSGTILGALTVGSTLGVTGVATTGGAIINGATTITGTTGITGSLSATGLVSFSNATASTSAVTGAVVVNGGVGIGGNLWVAGNINFAGNVNTVQFTGNSGQFFGNAAGFGALYTGVASGFVFQPQTVLQNSTNFNGYAQVNHQNINSGSQASGDFVVTADNGTALSGYIDMGIGSSTYNYAGFPLLKPNDGYLLVTGGTGTGGGNLVLTTGTANDIVFGPNNGEFGRITSGNVFLINQTGAATSTTTGVLRVAGGVGIQGALYVGGSVLAANSAVGFFSSINNTPIGTLTPSTGSFTTLSATGEIFSGSMTAGTFYATNFSTANAQISGGTFTGISATSATTATFTNLSSGNVLLTGGSISGLTNLNVTTETATNFASGNAVITGGSVNNTPVGATTASTGAFTTLSATGVTNITNTTASTNYSTGALLVAGGAGITGNVNIGGNLNVAGTITYINTNQEIVTGLEIVAGNLVANSGTTSTSVSTGAVVVVGGAGISGNLNVGSTSSLHKIKGNLLVGVGATAASAATTLEVNQNTDAPLNSTSIVHISALSGQTGKVTLDSFGNATTSMFVARTSNGSSTSPASVSTNSILGAFIARGYGTTGYKLNSPDTSAGLMAYAQENFSDSAQGTSLSINYIPTGTTVGKSGINIHANSGNVIISSLSNSIGLNSGALVVRGGASFSGNVNLSGNLYATSGTIFASDIENTPIGGSLPSTGSFTTLVSTSFNTGNAVITGGYISSLANLTVTTALATTLVSTNFSSGNTRITGGYIDGTPIGSFTPSTGAFTTLTTTGLEVVSGNLVAASNVPSFTPTSGAIVIAGTGGLGVGGNINVAQTLYVGASHLNYTPQNAGIQFGTSTNNFSQIVNQNSNSGNNASTDFAAVANNGSDNDTFVDMGITSSTYSQAAYTLYGANDGYLVVAGNTTTGGGNLILNTYNANDIIFATGGTMKNNEVARITSGNVFVIKSTINPAPAANVGSLQNWGSSSTTGNSYIGGATTLNGNKTAGNDVIIKGANDNTLIWARPNATYDQVLIGNSATVSTLVRGAKLTINSTDSMLLPIGTNAQRPSSIGGTDTQGMFRYNTTVNGIEWYTGTSWQAATTSFTVIADAQFAGTGAQVNYTLATAQTTASCIVSINGVVQIPTLAYSVSGTTLTFTEAPSSTDVIDVRMLTTTATVTQISSTSGYMQFLVDNNGAYVMTGTSGTTATTFWTPNGAEVNNIANVTASTTGNTTVDSFYANTYSSAEYTVTSTISGTTFREITKLLVVTDGTTAFRTVYGVTSTTGNTMSTWSANVVGGSVTLWATPANANTIYRIRKNYQTV